MIKNDEERMRGRDSQRDRRGEREDIEIKSLGLFDIDQRK